MFLGRFIFIVGVVLLLVGVFGAVLNFDAWQVTYLSLLIGPMIVSGGCGDLLRNRRQHDKPYQAGCRCEVAYGF